MTLTATAEISASILMQAIQIGDVARYAPDVSESSRIAQVGQVVDRGRLLGKGRDDTQRPMEKAGRMASSIRRAFVSGLVLAGIVFATDAFAQASRLDLAGEWSARVHEDAVYRGAGGLLGDYTGLPINAAARQMAESWDADVLSQPERMTQAWPAVYSMRGEGPNLRISEVRDPVSEQLIALRLVGIFGRSDRTIWVDGRPHPSDFAEYTWDGFSTGAFHDGRLTVTTTHMKMGVLQKVGVYASPYAVMTEEFFLHGEFLTMVAIIEDPIYLEEPLVRSQTWVRSATQNVGQAIPWESVDELAGKEVGWVPHYPLGTKHSEPAEQFNLPFEATQGGAVTTYPEYQRTIERLRAARGK